jgi:tripartite-type tricarboxylate transporter receptor subunit TctC
MKLPRRQFLRLAVGAVALPAGARTAKAQAYPAKPLRWIIGFPPGGGADTVARTMEPWLSKRLGQQLIIENRPGASTNIAVQAVVNSPPDGYTLLFLGASSVVNTHIFSTLPFNLQRDIAPVAGLVSFPMVMVANPSVPAKTVADLIARQGKSRQNHHGVVRDGIGLPSGGRAVQDDGRHRHDARSVSRRSGDDQRSGRRTGAGRV